MSKAIKFSDNVYLDSDSVVFKKRTLTNVLSYSEEEQVIGTWFGKPLYRRVFVFGALETGAIAHNIENVDHIHLGNGTGVIREDGYFGYNYWFDTNNYIAFLVDATNLYFDRVVTSGLIKVIFVLEYTKTTD